eukprot:NODE_1923_length_1561_cov_7.142559_g1830_i0.p1 GENE.NODE_1923_length_1561_cov_7.142559_g1830_i0~~NODE_1923_length_1561_cov_7.142559_g1830_i0.p1  ORF type:complete len:420 (-),score=115.05 NODE_1923_length_1561_cov_7.142559_g1830_i0:263-1522(-)
MTDPAIDIQGQIDDLKATHQVITARLAEIVNERVSAAQLDDDDLMDKLTAEAKEGKKRVAEIVTKISTLEDDLKVEVARHVTPAQHYDQTLSLQRQVGELQQQLHDADQRTAELMQEVRAQKAQMDTQKAQIDAQKGQIDTQKEQIDAQKGQMDAQKQQSKAVERRLNQEITELHAKVATMDAERKEERKEVDARFASLEHRIVVVPNIVCKVNEVNCTATITHPTMVLDCEQLMVTATVDGVQKTASLITKTAGEPIEVKWDKGTAIKVEVRYGGMPIPGSPFAYHDPDKLFGVGVGGTAYPDYRPITLEEIKKPAVHNRLLEVVNKLGGLPVIPSSLQCNHALYLSNGRWRVDGNGVVEVGYNSKQTITDGLYRPMNYQTKAKWPPAAGSLASSTVNEYPTNGLPQLFVATAWIIQF